MKPIVTYVLLADVVGSRRIQQRQSFDARLEAGMQKVAHGYAAAFEMPLRTWKGLDEIAAVVKSPLLLYTIMNELQDAAAPEKLRFVLVQGEIDVVPEDNDVRHADGNVFHQAAALMQQLKKDALLFSCQTLDPVWDKAMMTQVNLLMMIKEDWTERQRKIFIEYGKSDRQEEVAQQLHITQQTVSKALKAVKAVQVQKLEQALQEWCLATLNEP
jgi:hypothetical protein